MIALVEYGRIEPEGVHLRACAFLDACSHAGLWWLDHARQPFFAAAVGSYHVNSSSRTSNQTLWSIACAQSGPDPTFRIFDRDGTCMVHTVGGQQGFFALGWLEERRTRGRTFIVEWDRMDLAFVSQPPSLIALGTIDLVIRQVPVWPSLNGSVLIFVLPRCLAALPVLLAILGLVQQPFVNCARSVWALSSGAQCVKQGDLVRPSNAGSWGLSRSARSEIPLLGIRCGDVGHQSEQLSVSLAMYNCPSEQEVAQRAVLTYSVRLAAGRAARPMQVEELSTPASHLLTGGTGGIGHLVAVWLVKARDRSHLMLTTRTGVLPSKCMELRSCGQAVVVVRRCDAAEQSDVLTLAADMRQSLPPLRGVWHMAGLLADGLVARQGISSLLRAYRPKAVGARQLYGAFAIKAPLHACAYFSSVAGLIGSTGQANYAAANATLDMLAYCSREQGCVATSVAWGPWANVSRLGTPSLYPHAEASYCPL